MDVRGTLDHGSGRLPPRPFTTFVGREAERAAVLRSLHDSQVVTLVGPGGSGKTRLALELACDLQTAFPYGVHFVSLRMLRDPASVMRALASGIGLREHGERDLIEVLEEFVRTRGVTLILDGCDHAAEPSARAIEHLVRASPRVRALATSRHPLGIQGEAVVLLPALPVSDRSATVQDLLRADAARLFVDRARTVHDDFRPTPENADWVRRICLRLEGNPLALELAAARSGVVPIDEIAAALDEWSLQAGDVGSVDATAPPALRTAIDWTCALLPDPARTLLHRLSIFAHSFTLDAARAICGGDGIDTDMVDDLLRVLVRHSLVLPPGAATSPARYQLLDTVRDYGAGALAAAGGAPAIATRHLRFYLDLAERAAAKLVGEDQIEWFDLLETEHENFLAALAWSRDHRSATAAGVRLAGALWWFWYLRGYWSEGRAWLEELAAAVAPETPGVAFALGAAASIARQQRDYEGSMRLAGRAEALERAHSDARARFLIALAQAKVARERGDLAQTMEIFERSQALVEQIGDSWLAALALLGRGNLLMLLGRPSDALHRYEESLGLYLQLGDRWGIAHNLYRMAGVAVAFGALGRAASQLRESIALFRALGDRSDAAYTLIELGRVALRQGQVDSAAVALVESLVEHHALQDTRGIAQAFEAIARVQTVLGNYARAAYLLGAAAGMRDAIGHPLPTSQRDAHDAMVADLRAHGGVDAFEAAWAAGRRIAAEDAVDVILGWD